MKRLPLSGLLALAIVSTCQADEAYTLAKAETAPPAGTKEVRSRTSSLSDGLMKLTLPNQEVDGTGTIRETETAELEYTAADKRRLLVTTSGKVTKIKLNDHDVPPKERSSPLLNLPATFTRQADGKWTGTLEGGAAATPEQAKEITRLAKAFNSENDAKIYGTQPRKAGETWTADAALLPFAESDQKMNGQLKLTFKGIEDYQGTRCARLEGPLGLSTEGKESMTMSGDLVVLRSLADLADLRMEFTGKVTIKGPASGGKMEMGGNMALELTRKFSH